MSRAQAKKTGLPPPPLSGAPALLPLALLQKYYDPGSRLYHLLMIHSVLVAKKALEIAHDYAARHPGTEIDFQFLEAAALLHDIGIFRCHAPAIFCTGSEPYLRHTIIGREILEQEGWPRHALVCERHTGAGLTREEVVAQQLPLPARDYLPLTLEEKIICMADRFHVKEPARLYDSLTLPEIEAKMRTYGAPAWARWQELRRLFLPES